MLVASLLFACASAPGVGPSRIPGFAQPREFVEGDADSTDDLIRYRALGRGDFRAPGPPAYLGENAHTMVAVTCGLIRVSEEAGFEVVTSPQGVAVRGVGLVFEALMDRGCSWWNGERTDMSEAYVLEHEQVHLAIFEAEARRLTRRVGPAASASGPPGTDPQQLLQRVHAAVDGLLEEGKQAVLARSLEFDEDTSFGHAPELQRRWRDRLERELDELAP